MPDATTREIKSHLKTIKNIHKITKAMGAVAASRMKEAQKRAFHARPYIFRALEILYNLSQRGFEKEKCFLLRHRSAVKSIGIVFITPDRGLCGPLIGNLVRKAFEVKVKYEKEKKELKFIAIGKKGQNFLRRLGTDIIAAFPDKEKWRETDAGAIAHFIVSSFEKKEIDQVLIIYVNFISAVRQEVVAKILLPLSEENLRELVEAPAKKTTAPLLPPLYEVEPEPETLLNKLLPYLIKMAIYHFLLEAKASEHSARMLAMQNARRNAEEMLDDLTLTYNQVRQSTITQQLAEIGGGVAVMEG